MIAPLVRCAGFIRESGVGPLPWRASVPASRHARRSQHNAPRNVRLGAALPPDATPPPRERRLTPRAAFTIIEILSIMLIIAVLSSLLFPAMQSLHRAFDRRRAAAETRSLVSAVLAYRTVYGQWPLQDEPDGLTTADLLVFGGPDDGWQGGLPLPDQARLIGALTTNELYNPRQELFIEIPEESLIEGRFVDPWDQPYLVAMALASDPVIAGSATRTNDALTLQIPPVNEPAIAVSWGPPHGHSIYSWSQH